MPFCSSRTVIVHSAVKRSGLEVVDVVVLMRKIFAAPFRRSVTEWIPREPESVRDKNTAEKKKEKTTFTRELLPSSMGGGTDVALGSSMEGYKGTVGRLAYDGTESSYEMWE